MNFPQHDTLLNLMFFLLWSALSTQSYVNGLFRIFLATTTALNEVFVRAGLVFAPGLFAVLQAATPPTAAWFESLSSDIPPHVFGIYVLVLRKDGHRVRIYFGSGTSAYRGIGERLSEHDRRVCVPAKVQEAYDAGFTLVHSALLCHCPIPAAGFVPIYRLLFVALEHVLTHLFCGWYYRQRTHLIGSVCPWSPSQFTYVGLNTHSPMCEPILGDYDLTHEQLEEMAATRDAHNKEYQRQYGRELRANPTEAHKATVKANNAKQREALKPIHANRKANHVFHCATCNYDGRSQGDLNQHNRTARHLRKVKEGGRGPHCELCNLSFKFPSDVKEHEKTRAHQLLASMTT